MKMMMMMMMMFLVLSCVSADILHQDLNILGCSSSDGEYMYALDGEEVWFADFIKKKGVDPQPDFVDHVTYPEGAYQQAEGEQQTCRFNLDVCRKAYKDLPLEQGTPASSHHPKTCTLGSLVTLNCTCSFQSDDLPQRQHRARTEERPHLSCDRLLSCSCEDLLDQERRERDRRNQHQRSLPQQGRDLQPVVQAAVPPPAGRHLQLHRGTPSPGPAADQDLGCGED
ncbi:uncharacterized protein [Pempheris klunzingeri]|uniref:uncharacterized protein isoform X2 n=1 Tax=Pempheris klunzingeri TaxID=3127111 RepID=UPI00398033CB